MNSNLHYMSSNQILNNLDGLLAQGYTIDEIVSAIDNIRIIANYDLLKDKGASNIDLAKIKDSVDPEVVYNNIETFVKAGIQIDVKISFLDLTIMMSSLSRRMILKNG